MSTSNFSFFTSMSLSSLSESILLFWLVSLSSFISPYNSIITLNTKWLLLLYSLSTLWFLKLFGFLSKNASKRVSTSAVRISHEIKGNLVSITFSIYSNYTCILYLYPRLQEVLQQYKKSFVLFYHLYN